MKILTWNVCGLGGVKKRRFVRECISKYNSIVTMLQETKKDTMLQKLVKSSMGPKFSEWCVFPTIGTSGGILIAWDPLEVRKVDEIMGNFSLSIRLIKESSGFEWLLIGVYGPCRPQFWSNFWDELQTIRSQWLEPWIVGGDFNVIRFTHEKN